MFRFLLNYQVTTQNPVSLSTLVRNIPTLCASYASCITYLRCMLGYSSVVTTVVSVSWHRRTMSTLYSSRSPCDHLMMLFRPYTTLDRALFHTNSNTNFFRVGTDDSTWTSKPPCHHHSHQTYQHFALATLVVLHTYGVCSDIVR